MTKWSSVRTFIVGALFSGIGCSLAPSRNTGPTASFKLLPFNATGPGRYDVTFDASGSNDDSAIVTYQWDFGDDSAVASLPPGTGRTPTHTYLASSGSFTVKLTVIDDDGLMSAPFSQRLTLATQQPANAQFTFGPVNATAPVVITFDATATSDPDPNDTPFLEFDWDFGDGQNATTQNRSVTHLYQKAGNYPVSLVVKQTKQGGVSSAPIVAIVHIN
jgi:PKD repeat protein